jgi:hypothetical protein
MKLVGLIEILQITLHVQYQSKSGKIYISQFKSYKNLSSNVVVAAELTMISASHDLQPLSLCAVVEIVIDNSITFPELSSCGVECILKRCIAHVHVYSLVLFTQNVEEVSPYSEQGI